MIYARFLKRFIDFCLSLSGLIILSPLFVFLTVLLFVVNSGKPFFFQTRPGKNERLFKIIKFKTMNDKTDETGNLLPNIQRLTKIGTFVRRASLDELPQLINVLTGDMSLIGPRPLLTEYLPLYNEQQKRRHEVRPGVTGWAQVNGRNAIDWHKRFELDVWYIDNLSFRLDLKILYLTLVKVFKSEGINSSGKETMKKFKGN